MESLDEPRFAALCALLDEITSGRHPVPAEVTLRSGLDKAHRQLRKATKKVRRLLDDGAEAGPALHRVRKRAKKLRYAAEAVTVAEPSAADVGSAAKALQTVLGDHQDGVLARAWIIDTVAQAREDDEDTFTYGLLYATEEQRADRAVDALPQHVKAIGAPTGGSSGSPEAAPAQRPGRPRPPARAAPTVRGGSGQAFHSSSASSAALFRSAAVCSARSALSRSGYGPIRSNTLAALPWLTDPSLRLKYHCLSSSLIPHSVPRRTHGHHAIRDRRVTAA